jgi:hypothetical protein
VASRSSSFKPADLRSPQEFMSAHVQPRINELSRRYIYAHACPIEFTLSTQNLGTSEILDATFGLPSLCRIAGAYWRVFHDLGALIPTVQDQATRLGHPFVQHNYPQHRDVNLRIPARDGKDAYVIAFSALSFYPCRDVANIHNLHDMSPAHMLSTTVGSVRNADFGSLDDDQVAFVESIRSWADEAVGNAATVAHATKFLRAAMSSAGSMRAFFDTLPSFMDTCRALGVEDGPLQRANLPWRGHDTFDQAAMRDMVPGWSSQWGAVRTALLMMAVADRHEDKMPPRLVVMRHMKHIEGVDLE